MAIKIADTEGAWEIEVPLRGATLEALRLQINRLRSEDYRYSAICERIGNKISETVLDVLDPDLRPPTEAQVKFALAITRELTVNLPGEALQFRSAMHDFISRHSELFYARTNRRPS